MYILFCIYIYIHTYIHVYMCTYVYTCILHNNIYIYVNGIPILNHPTHSRCIRQETLQAQPPPGAVPPRNRCAATWRRPKQRCLALQREWGLGPEDDRWVKRIKYDDIIYIYIQYTIPTSTKSLKKTGRAIKTWFSVSFFMVGLVDLGT